MRDKLIEIMKHRRHLETSELADFLLENGVIVPPCKVGDTVYRIFNKKVVAWQVIEIPVFISMSGTFLYVTAQNWGFASISSISLDPADFGKTVFLTREEAEAALKGGAE